MPAPSVSCVSFVDLDTDSHEGLGCGSGLQGRQVPKACSSPDSF